MGSTIKDGSVNALKFDDFAPQAIRVEDTKTAFTCEFILPTSMNLSFIGNRTSNISFLYLFFNDILDIIALLLTFA